ncbi:iron complex transport system ATP-binding protein [Dethiosulfatibacter aminovorans DSM 17477]|uniref:Iron complex transport system ATP-binding protein n=1 Tax=Dethiosulfatibacter aminovorans DSM 17477 TaxID=1121476 RepID=A0A1M6KB33_9FIRM|nr:ABC transporter ATP-binding protein [Dethiosulfatibacter aminovorans]SHJ56124.1 iron complex transport system ATP-binding protein [Dethiosulfatibacter aminovorans DSM 17477]
MIKANNINFGYGSKAILNNVSLNIRENTFNSIIGPNGAGKTTFMRLLSGLNKSYEGNITYRDNDYSNIGPKERAKSYAIVQQHYSTRFTYTCYEMICMGRHPHTGRLERLGRDDYDMINSTIEALEIQELAGKKTSEISGGEFQKVILARALVQKPEVLFLDEAFSEMDISAKLAMIKMLKKSVDEKKLTVVAIMHDLNTAYRYSDGIHILKSGELYASGNPNEVFTEKSVKDVFNLDVEILPGKGFIIK